MNKESILVELNSSIAEKEVDKEYIKKLKRSPDKVKYLRTIKGYTQMEAAEMIGISSRQVRRIENKFKMSS